MYFRANVAVQQNQIIVPSIAITNDCVRKFDPASTILIHEVMKNVRSFEGSRSSHVLRYKDRKQCRSTTVPRKFFTAEQLDRIDKALGKNHALRFNQFFAFSKKKCWQNLTYFSTIPEDRALCNHRKVDLDV